MLELTTINDIFLNLNSLQRCPLKIGSCKWCTSSLNAWQGTLEKYDLIDTTYTFAVGYDSTELRYQWNQNRTVDIAPDMKMSQFDLISTPVGNSTVFMKSGNWAVSRTYFTLRNLHLISPLGLFSFDIRLGHLGGAVERCGGHTTSLPCMKMHTSWGTLIYQHFSVVFLCRIQLDSSWLLLWLWRGVAGKAKKERQEQISSSSYIWLYLRSLFRLTAQTFAN